jgi:type IV pilus modification protein PilV
MKQPLKFTNQKFLPVGFTLVEILVSLMVLAVGCLGAISLQISAMKGGAQADQMTVAYFIAESQLELLRSKSFNDVPSFLSDLKQPEILWRDGQKLHEDKECTTRCYSRTTTIRPKHPTTLSHEIFIEVKGPGGVQGLDNDTFLSNDSFK